MKRLLVLFAFISLTISSAMAAWNEVQILIPDDATGSECVGRNVEMDGNYAITGVYTDDDIYTNAGSAYIFYRNGDSWEEQAKLVASDGYTEDHFGNSASISGDYAIVGAPYNDDNGSCSGSAYIFHRVGTTWTQQAKLRASNAVAGDYFGYDVAISGDYAIVGAYNHDTVANSDGAAYIFERSGETWTETAILLGTDPETSDFFGYSVAIDGNYCFVGAWGDDDSGSSAGAAYVFHNIEDVWTLQQKLLASDGMTYDNFSKYLAISGDYAIISAYNVDGECLNSGAAYIFHLEDEIWTEQVKLLPSKEINNGAFGYDVDISGEHAVVGMYMDNVLGSTSGSVYFYRRSGTMWLENDYVTASDGETYDKFGYSVAISGENAIAGTMHYDSETYLDTGALYFLEFVEPGTGNDAGTPADEDPLAVDVVPLESYDYDGNGAVVVDPDVDVNPEESGASIMVDIVVLSGNSNVNIPDNASLTYQVTVFGTDQPVELVLHYDGLPFTPTELVYNNGGTWVAIPGVVWDGVNQTATFTWTFGSTRDGSDVFVMNNGAESTLPVELSSFAASVTTANTVMIEWTTQSESDMMGYYVMRADNEEIDDAFLLNHEIISAANSGAQTDYSFEDIDVTSDVTYSYWLQSIEYGGAVSFFGPVTCAVTPNEEEPDAPEVVFATGLNGNFPNPFNPSTTVSFSLAECSNVTLEVFNTRGQKVATLLNDKEMAKGDHGIVWDAEGNASGVYFVRMTTDSYTENRRMLMLK